MKKQNNFLKRVNNRGKIKMTVNELFKVWLAGFEAGQIKWHKVSDGDLPKVHSTVLDENGDKVVYIGEGEWEAFSEYYERYVGVDQPIAWCEIPEFEE
jgi:hypothetical protein